MASNDNKLILIDGSSFLYRAYYAVRQRFSTKTGLATGATFIITRMLQSLLNTYQGAQFLVVFDAPGASEFRKAMYTEYKANRPPMPEELRVQVQWVHSVVNAMGLPLIQMQGVEADDVLGSYALAGALAQKEVIIATGDKDLAQLVSDERHISMIDTMRDITYNEAQVKEKFGVPPEHIIDLLALKGDSSDNIPGMKGVGDKTALALIQGLGGIFDIKEHADDIASLSFRGASKFKARFLEQWSDIELSYRLATIRCDLELPLPIAQIPLPQINYPELLALYEQLEFHSFAHKLRESKASASAGNALGIAAGNALGIAAGNALGIAAGNALGTVGVAGAAPAVPFGVKTAESTTQADFDLLPTPPRKMAANWQQKRGSGFDERNGLAAPAVSDFGTMVPPRVQNLAPYGLAEQINALQQAQSSAQRRSNAKWLRWINCALTSLNLVSAVPEQREVGALRDNFHLVTTIEELKDLVAKLKASSYFGFFAANNLPAQGASVADGILVGLAVCLDGREAYYVPINHTYLGAGDQLSLTVVKRALGPIFADGALPKVAYNSNHQHLLLSFAGMELEGLLPDPIIVEHLTCSTRPTDFNALCQSNLHYTPIELSSLLTGQLTCDLVEIERFMDYACEQAVLVWRLYGAGLGALSKYPDWLELLDFDDAVNAVVYGMERWGVKIDSAELHKQSRSLKESLYLTEQDIFDFSGGPVNLQSPKQLSEMLFEQMALPYPTSKEFKAIVKAVSAARAKDPSDPLNPEVKAILREAAESKARQAAAGTSSKQSYSTADDILTELNKIHPIAGCIQRYRMLSKLISTYADKLPQLISEHTGRIHAVFNVAGTVTGRLSSSAPNLQNIPARTQEGRQIRLAFVAPEGYTMVSADYSQIELRLIAHFSQDPNLVAAFQNGLDIHRATAAEVLGKPIDQVTDEERAHAKATNFGLMYGMQAHGLAKQTKMSYQEAKSYIERYFQRYPSIAGFMEQIVAEAKHKGYVSTLLGNRIYVEGINGEGPAARGAERAAINAPMQGSAADIIKKAMIEVDAYIKTLPEDAVHLTMQVHDELVFEVKDELVASFSAKIKDIMEHVVTLSVPLEVGIGSAHSWADAH